MSHQPEYHYPGPIDSVIVVNYYSAVDYRSANDSKHSLISFIWYRLRSFMKFTTTDMESKP